MEAKPIFRRVTVSLSRASAMRTQEGYNRSVQMNVLVEVQRLARQLRCFEGSVMLVVVGSRSRSRSRSSST